MKTWSILTIFVSFFWGATAAKAQESDGLKEEVAQLTPPSRTDQPLLSDFQSQQNQRPFHKPPHLPDDILVKPLEELALKPTDFSPMVADISKENLRFKKELLAGKKPNQLRQKGAVDSFLFYQKGALRLEQYFAYSAIDRPHFQMSITKSMTALAVGLALEEGIFHSVEDPVLKYFPFDQGELPEAAFQIKMKDALTMQSGIRLPKNFKPATVKEDLELWRQIFKEAEYHPAGTTYKYQGIDPSLFSSALYLQTGKTMEEYLHEKLLMPMGIKAAFSTTPQGMTKAPAGMDLTSRDMLKLGILVLEQGKFAEHQFLSSSWIKEMTDAYAQNGKNEYGYFWWRHVERYNEKEIAVISARGAGGQFIFILPEFEAICIFTSYGTRKPFQYLSQEIIPILAGGKNSRNLH
ncbi:serine hydrolase [Persicobacter sp. CCB-QB2]|uniref:serine hydrolase domain-containing protein n=1 Tax=Persicobacter sp. CCB-QB2 TaxID=1561025 RepID=UPI0006A987D2|nr:serine hydrolase [Persicobacter sp. CCB-QB2]